MGDRPNGSGDGQFHVLTIPTLLIHKLLAAIDRAQPDVQARVEKQINDVTDFDFLLQFCHAENMVLLPIHRAHLDQPENVQRFAQLRMELDIPDGWRESWAELVERSGFGREWA